jgi:hypothetical protein
MLSDNLPADPVQLHYVLTSDDLLDAFAGRDRRISRAWYLRWLVPLLTVGVIAAVFGYSVYPEGIAADASGFAVAAAFIVVGLVVLGLSLLSRPLSGGSWIYRLPVRQVMRGNPALSQPMHATVADSGLHVSNAEGNTTTSWSQYPVHLETDRSFVLLASERRGGAVLVLPKRGLDESSLARLRWLLAVHSRCLS